MKNNFGKNLKQLRKNNNLSQKDLAKKLGIARSTVSYYENGTNEPDLYNLIKISEFFDCSIDFLVYSDISLNKESVLNPNQFTFLDEFDIDRFSREKLIKKLQNSKQYYINSLDKLKLEVPKKINEIDTLISFLKSTSTSDDTTHCCTIENIKIKSESEFSDEISIPLIGTIAAGSPILAISNIEDYLDLPLKAPLHSCKNYYCLKVKGNSMNKLFENGDILIIEETNNVNDYDIAVVLIDNTEATVKKVKFEDNFIYLIPESNDPTHKVQKYNAKMNVQIQGKFITTLKEYLDN